MGRGGREEDEGGEGSEEVEWEKFKFIQGGDGEEAAERPDWRAK